MKRGTILVREPIAGGPDRRVRWKVTDEDGRKIRRLYALLLLNYRRGAHRDAYDGVKSWIMAAICRRVRVAITNEATVKEFEAIERAWNDRPRTDAAARDYEAIKARLPWGFFTEGPKWKTDEDPLSPSEYGVFYGPVDIGKIIRMECAPKRISEPKGAGKA